MTVPSGIDLADPDIPAGPPPAHLLAPAWAFAVLLPLALAGLLFLGVGELQKGNTGLAQHIVRLESDVAQSRAARSRTEMLVGVAASADAVRRDAVSLLDALPAIAMGMPPELRLQQAEITSGIVRVTGQAASASDVSAWLAAIAGATGPAAIEWLPPELRHSGGARSGVEFTMHGRRVDGTAEVAQ